MRRFYMRVCVIICLLLGFLFQTTVYGAERTITIVLERVYIGGDMSDEVYTTTEGFKEIKETFRGWNFISGDNSQIIFQKKINDISPMMKTNGYLGLSSDGILKIFEGTPNDEKVIQSFFQIDTEKLQTYQRNQLKRGIKIHTKTDYQKLIDEMKLYHKK